MIFISVELKLKMLPEISARERGGGACHQKKLFADLYRDCEKPATAVGHLGRARSGARMFVMRAVVCNRFWCGYRREHNSVILRAVIAVTHVGDVLLIGGDTPFAVLVARAQNVALVKITPVQNRWKLESHFMTKSNALNGIETNFTLELSQATDQTVRTCNRHRRLRPSHARGNDSRHRMPSGSPVVTHQRDKA